MGAGRDPSVFDLRMAGRGGALGIRKNYKFAFLRRRAWTFSPLSSRSASRAIQRAVLPFRARISSDRVMAALLSARLRLPMLRTAQLTAFLTKLRGSVYINSENKASCYFHIFPLEKQGKIMRGRDGGFPAFGVMRLTPNG